MMRAITQWLVMALTVAVLLISCQASVETTTQDPAMMNAHRAEADQRQPVQADNGDLAPQSLPSLSSEGEERSQDLASDPESSLNLIQGNQNTTENSADKDAAGQRPDSKDLEQATDKEAPKQSPNQTSLDQTIDHPATEASNDELSESAEPSPADTDGVHVMIRGEGEIGIILDTFFELEGESTVLDVMKKVTRANKIQMEYRGGNGAFAYVEGIHNLYEFDHGPESGWLFKVNDVESSKSAGVTKVVPGDRIEWIYMLQKGTEDGKDE